MKYIDELLQGIPIIKAILIIGLGSIMWHGIRTFFETYIKSRTTSVAADVNLQSEIQRLIISEEAKVTVNRIKLEKVSYAMNILRLMAKIESKISDWDLTVYFRKKDIDESKTIEDIGSEDLAIVANLLVEMISEANASIVLFGEDFYSKLLSWTTTIHGLIFELEAIYQTSKKINNNLDGEAKERLETISNLKNEDVIAEKFQKMGTLKKEITQLLIQQIDI